MEWKTRKKYRFRFRDRYSKSTLTRAFEFKPGYARIFDNFLNPDKIYIFTGKLALLGSLQSVKGVR